MPVNSRIKAMKIMGQKKAFYRQRIPESSCGWKETVDIDILVTSSNGDKKNHAIYQNSKWTFLKNKEVETVQPAQMNIYQSNNYRQGFKVHNDEPRVQERQ